MGTAVDFLDAVHIVNGETKEYVPSIQLVSNLSQDTVM
jgi:hypothetical protein